jgi:hypothetical protein
MSQVTTLKMRPGRSSGLHSGDQDAGNTIDEAADPKRKARPSTPTPLAGTMRYCPNGARRAGLVMTTRHKKTAARADRRLLHA